MQVGALRSLLEHNVLPDTLVGCSVGALNAAQMAREISLEQVEHVADIWRQVSRRIVYPGGRMSVLWRIATGQDSLHDNRHFYQFLQDSGCTPALTFGAITGAHLFVTATVFRSGRMHVFGDDPNDRVLDALMASTALTPLHPPWEINGERYVDGGTVTPLPLRVALDRGATEIWALHLLDERGRDADAEAHSAVAADQSAPPVHGVAGHISKAVDTMLRLQVEHDLHLVSGERRVKFHHVPLVAPHRIEPTDFSQAEALMAAGYEQTNTYLELPTPVVASGRPRHNGGWWQTMWGRWQAS
jgi:NTE family protein